MAGGNPPKGTLRGSFPPAKHPADLSGTAPPYYRRSFLIPWRGGEAVEAMSIARSIRAEGPERPNRADGASQRPACAHRDPHADAPHHINVIPPLENPPGASLRQAGVCAEADEESSGPSSE